MQEVKAKRKKATEGVFEGLGSYGVLSVSVMRVIRE